MLTYYRVEYPDKHFYIGSTISENIEGYLKRKHRILSKKYKLDYLFSDIKIKTKTDFSSERELRDFERKNILKYFKRTKKNTFEKTNNLCLNTQVQTNYMEQVAKANVCPECGGRMNLHKKTCSKYKCPKPCEECGQLYGHHKKTCSHYSETIPCSECGCINSHKKSCSKYKEIPPCSECGGKHNVHKKGCSKYKEVKCQECGGIKGHFDFCSQSLGKCEHCGYSLQSHRHAKDCPLYKPEHSTIVCPECGGKRGNHKNFCSKHKQTSPCSECGAKKGHKKTCSKYKVPTPCPLCGGKRSHKKDCPKSKRNKRS